MTHSQSLFENDRQLLTLAATVVGVTLLYGALAWFGITLTRAEGRIAAVWVPNALLLAVLLRHDRSFAPVFVAGCFAANVVANLLLADTLAMALGLGLANMTEVIAAVWMLDRLGHSRPDFMDNRQTLTFVGVAIVASALSGGIASFVLDFGEGAATMLDLWFTWMRADALGLLLLVPALTIMLDAIAQKRRLPRERWAEAAAIVVLGTAISIWTFWQTRYPFLFLDAPIVLIYAIRLGPVGNAFALVNLAVVASVFTMLGSGPINLVQGGLADKLMVLQVFLASSFAIGLPVAALIRQIERQTDARARFLANMSHDIRTPMNGVMGFTELLMMSDLGPHQRRYAERIQASGETMMQLLNDILDLSKIQSGKLELVEGRLEIRKEIAACLAMFEATAANKNLSLAMDVDPSLPAAMQSDPLRVRQVLLNLIGNALKFTPKGSVTVLARHLRTGASDRLVIEVRDTGIGISEDALQRIFNQYEQAERATQKTFGGTGLGLAISRQLVEMMGGTVTVTSQKGVGTSFVVTLPLVAYAEKMEAEEEEDAGTPLAQAA